MGARDRSDLGELIALADMCRDKGIISLERGPDGYVKMLFGPPPVKASAKKDDKGDDGRAAKRAHYTNLLDRAVSDPELDALP